MNKKPTGEVQKTLTIGYFIEKFDNIYPFNSKDLETGFRAAKEIVPRNINFNVIKNIQKGHMMEAKDKKDNLKAWILTNSGEGIVEKGFVES